MLKKRVKTRSKPDPIDAATVERWRDRRDKISEKLVAQEQAEWAWLWRTRLSVLDYLIDRYGTKQETGQPRKKTVMSGDVDERVETGEVREESILPYNRPPTSGLSWIADSKKEAIHERLASLQSANTERHVAAEKLAEQLREEMRSLRSSIKLTRLEQSRLAETLSGLAGGSQEACPQASEDRADQVRLVEALNELDEREYKALRRFIAFDLGLLEYTDEPLDEDSIRMILSEHGIEPDEAS